MLSRWEGAKPCARRRMSGESERGIFCINPPKQRPAFFRIRRDEFDAGWRRQKRDCWRINNLKNVETESVRDE